MQLKTDYKDFEFTSGETLRKYRMINNPDGTVSFQDVTDYQAIGDRISASDLNTSNNEINTFEQDTATKLSKKADKTELGEQVNYEFNEVEGELNIIAKV